MSLHPISSSQQFSMQHRHQLPSKKMSAHRLVAICCTCASLSWAADTKAAPAQEAAPDKAPASAATAATARAVPMPPALAPAAMPSALGLAALDQKDAKVGEWSVALADKKVAEVLADAQAVGKKGNAAGHFVCGWLHATGQASKEQNPDVVAAEKAYRAGASAGHDASKFNLALLLLQNQDPAKRQEAVKLLIELAEKDPAQAGFWHGYASMIGAAAEPDFHSGIELWKRAAEAKNPEAFLHLGLAYSGQYGFPARTNYQKAAAFWQQGAEQGQAACALRLGHFLLADAKLAGMKDEDCAKYLQQASEAKLAEGTYLLAEVRRAGAYGAEKKDLESAAGLYQLAAEAGYVPAMLRLADLLERGEGAAKDEKGAAKVWMKAAGSGSAEGLWKLSQMHQNGTHGIEKDEKMAVKAALDAAMRGSAAAAGFLGASYRKGDSGLLRDGVAARSWLQQAAGGGDGKASTAMAEMMLSGETAMGKADELRALLIQGVNAKDAQAGYLLAKLMLDGRVLQKSIPAAHAWMKWASEEGHESAKKELSELEAKMSKDEKEQASKVYQDLQVK